AIAPWGCVRSGAATGWRGPRRESPQAGLSSDQEFGAFEIKAEPDLLEPSLAHGVAEFGFFLFGVKHEEPSAAGADEFAAQSAVGPGQFVPLVNLRVAHAAAADPFALPMFVHQPRKLAEIAALQRALAG